jgi:hypothetical protein
MKWKIRLNVTRGIYEVFMYFMYFNIVRDNNQCCGSALVLMQIRIQLFISIRIWIRIQGAKPIRIHADPDLDPAQTLKSQKVKFLHEKYT